MNESISVVIPSALRKAPDGELWLTKALRSVAGQTLQPKEIIVGVDPGTPAIHGEWSADLNVRIVDGKINGHQSASNAAVAASTSPLVCFLEDDDAHMPWHLETLLGAMQRWETAFVSTSQQQVEWVQVGEARHLPDGGVRWEMIDKGVFDFPTASGWLFKREAWDKIGGFDTSYSIHHDNHFLGQLNKHRIRRVHLVENMPNPPMRQQMQVLPLFTWIVPGNPRGLTVMRTVHPQSIMAGVAADDAKKQRSALEYQSLAAEFGHVPW